MADHVFVCYAREDGEFVLKLSAALRARGVNVWLDQWNIPTGADWDICIDNAIYDCARFLIVLSPASVESSEVRAELRTALDEAKPIVPILHQTCRIPRHLRLTQYVDFIGHAADESACVSPLLAVIADMLNSDDMVEIIDDFEGNLWSAHSGNEATCTVARCLGLHGRGMRLQASTTSSSSWWFAFKHLGGADWRAHASLRLVYRTAAGNQEWALGVKDKDGEVWWASVDASEDWRMADVPFSRLRLDPYDTPGNGKLDLDEVQEVRLRHVPETVGDVDLYVDSVVIH